MNEPNPYAPPAVESDLTFSVLTPWELRSKLLTHEAVLRAVGLYYLTSSLLLGIGALVVFVVWLAIAIFGTPISSSLGEQLVAFIGPLVSLGIAVFGVKAGCQLRDLLPPTSATRISAVIGFFSFPFGTLTSLYLWYALYRSPLKTIVSDQYQQAIAETPTLKKSFDWVVWLLFAILTPLLIAFAVVGVHQASKPCY